MDVGVASRATAAGRSCRLRGAIGKLNPAERAFNGTRHGEFLPRRDGTDPDGSRVGDGHLDAVVDDEGGRGVFRGEVAPFTVTIDEPEIGSVRVAIEAAMNGVVGVSQNELGLIDAIGSGVER